MRTIRTYVGFSIALLFLLGADVASSGRSCIDFVARVVPGDEVTVQSEDPVWFELAVLIDNVYRFEIGAIPGTSFELWELGYNEGEDCFFQQEQLLSGELDDMTATFDWTKPVFEQVGLFIQPPVGGGEVSLSVSLEELAERPADKVLVIPAVAHAPGVNGELFLTDVVIYHHESGEAPVQFFLVPSGGGPEWQEEMTIGPHQIVALNDIVANVFGLDGVIGALRIHYPAYRSLHVVSRTYTASDEGTYGQFIPAQKWFDSAGRGRSGAVRTLPHLEKSEAFRSNAGFVEVLGLEAELDLEMRDGSGAVIGRRTITLPPSSHRQINDIFAFLGIEGSDNASLRVEVLNQARVLSYASVVDNDSSDPVFIPGLVTDPASYSPPPDASRGLLVPAAAATAGVYGTSWRTDLRVMQVDDTTGSVDITFVPGNGAPSSTRTFAFSGLGPLAIDDVVSVLGATGNGYLELYSQDSPIMATSRTFTLATNGTYGQYIPACSSLDAPGHGLIVGLKGSEHYRSNIGLVNRQGNPVEVEMQLFSASNELLGSRIFTLASLERRQINDVFRFLGAVGCEVCRLEYRVERGGNFASVYVHGSVIDNRSGDPVYLPAFWLSYQSDEDRR